MQEGVVLSTHTHHSYMWWDEEVPLETCGVRGAHGSSNFIFVQLFNDEYL